MGGGEERIVTETFSFKNFSVARGVFFFMMPHVTWMSILISGQRKCPVMIVFAVISNGWTNSVDFAVRVVERFSEIVISIQHLLEDCNLHDYNISSCPYWIPEEFAQGRCKIVGFLFGVKVMQRSTYDFGQAPLLEWNQAPRPWRCRHIYLMCSQGGFYVCGFQLLGDESYNATFLNTFISHGNTIYCG